MTALNDGGFMVAWTNRDGTEGDGSAELDIYAQRFDSNGNAVGTQIHIDKPGDQGFGSLDIATLADGRVILTYGSETGDSTNVTTLNYQIYDPREATISATQGNDNFVSREDGATIFGLDGDDRLTGRGAADVLYGGAGNDSITGGTGNDYIQGDTGDDRIDGEDGLDRLYGGEGNDAIYGGFGDDFIHALQGNDLTSGGAGNDTLDGHDGNDVIDGGTGNDLLYGGAGNDSITGGAGNDRIEGGSGLDLMNGGTGADQFVFDDGYTGLGATARDRISGFSHSQGDKLNVDGVDADLNVVGDQDFVFKGTAAFTGIGQMRVVTSGTDRILQFNNDSDLAADFEINLQGFNANLVLSDFSHL